MYKINLENQEIICRKGRNKNLHRKYEVTINRSSTEIYDKDNDVYKVDFYENELLTLKCDNGKEIECYVSYKDYKEDSKSVYISQNIIKENGGSDRFLSLESKPHLKFEKAMIASIDNVKSSNVEIYYNDINAENDENIDFQNPKIIGIRIVNNLNGASIYVDKNNVILKTEESASGNKIRINQEQRMMLDLEIPSFINQYYLDKFKKSNIQELSQYYKKEEDNFLCELEKNLYEIKQDIVKAFSEINNGTTKIYKLSVYPVFQKINTKISIGRRIKYFILKSLIRNKTKVKMALRPYSTDESDNVIRLTENSIVQLGIEEGDFVVIRNQFNKKSLRVKALKIEDTVAIFQENRIISEQFLNLAIGIPLHLRNKIELDSINLSVEVERDMGFLFKKHLNAQIQSLIGVVLSIIALKDYVENEIVLLFISFAIFVVLAFFSFSDIREKVDIERNSDNGR